MSITTRGWGSSAITTAGWSCPVGFLVAFPSSIQLQLSLPVATPTISTLPAQLNLVLKMLEGIAGFQKPKIGSGAFPLECFQALQDLYRSFLQLTNEIGWLTVYDRGTDPRCFYVVADFINVFKPEGNVDVIDSSDCFFQTPRNVGGETGASRWRFMPYSGYDRLKRLETIRDVFNNGIGKRCCMTVVLAIKPDPAITDGLKRVFVLKRTMRC